MSSSESISFHCLLGTDLSVNFRDGPTANLEGAQPYPGRGGFCEFVNPPAFLFKTSSGNGLDVVIVGTGTVAGRVSYWEQ